MPELAEVETIRRNLLPLLGGQELSDLELRRDDLGISRQSDPGPSVLSGCILNDIRRRGKYLDFIFSEKYHLLVHLGMSGKLIYLSDKSLTQDKTLYNDKHTHAVFHFGEGVLLFNDVRRFGRLDLSSPEPGKEPPLLQRLGPDALDPSADADYLYAQKKKHPKLSVKAFLLNQQIIAGLGNIYTDEILFAAGIRPDTRVYRLSKKDFARMIPIMREILTASVQSGGTSFRDYRNALNHKGSYQKKLAVYGRAGKACPRCGHILSSKKIAGRSSVYCKQCQIKK